MPLLTPIQMTSSTILPDTPTGSTARVVTTAPGHHGLARAAYNYQYTQKDPGGFAHNNKYIGQALYDNLADLEASDYADGLTDGKIRPE